jgi:acetyl-CoA acetyltransferase
MVHRPGTLLEQFRCTPKNATVRLEPAAATPRRRLRAAAAAAADRFDNEIIPVTVETEETAVVSRDETTTVCDVAGGLDRSS